MKNLILIILLILFIPHICKSSMLAIEGVILCDSIGVRNTLYDWVVDKSTSCWVVYYSTPTKIDYNVSVGTTPAHYDLQVNFRINNQSIKANIKNYVKALVNNIHILRIKAKIHSCNLDGNIECNEIEELVK